MHFHFLTFLSLSCPSPRGITVPSVATANYALSNNFLSEMDQTSSSNSSSNSSSKSNSSSSNAKKSDAFVSLFLKKNPTRQRNCAQNRVFLQTRIFFCFRISCLYTKCPVQLYVHVHCYLSIKTDQETQIKHFFALQLRKEFGRLCCSHASILFLLQEQFDLGDLE